MTAVDLSKIKIRRAGPDEAEKVSSILTEAALWLESRGEKLWEAGELKTSNIARDVENGRYRIAEAEGEAVGCFRYQDSDPDYWDDVPHEDSAFVHRVAVKRDYAGKGIPERMIEWAKKMAKSDGKKFLRLDCADRPKLRAMYERLGFVYHSHKHRSPYLVIRYEFRLDNLH